ncbi:MAG TPA: twin-arginine translocase TatA/TatE family subunit [Acidimicrobiales bacterium]|nr:twin-arginine translocase TatA/TatE family subunit [Acidimicrobiales bacterium]
MHFAPSAEIFGVDGIIILIVVVLVLFGSTQIPKLARSLGSAQKEFKKGLDEGASADDKGVQAAAAIPPPAPTPAPAPAPQPVVTPPAAPAAPAAPAPPSGDGSATAPS